MPRFATFNVRHGQGTGSWISLTRTARAIQQLDADVVSVNELYRLGQRYDQPGRLADLLDMHVTFQPNVTTGALEYGNAILSRHPLEQVELTSLPSRREQRGLMVARTRAGEHDVTCAVTHLSLHRATRAEQLATIAEELPHDEPLVFSGDLNCEHHELHPLAHRLEIAHHSPDTFPAVRPFRAYDHILWSEHWDLEHVTTSDTWASDHLPLVATLRMLGDPDPSDSGETR